MTLEEMEKRLRTLEDIEEIKKLQARYVNCLTTAKWDEVTDYFAENALVDLLSGKAKGKKEIGKLFREKISGMHVGLEGNLAVHPIITVEGDRAKGSWLMYIQFANPRDYPPEFIARFGEGEPDWMQGFYEMEYTRVDGKWKISLLRWTRRLWSRHPEHPRGK